ncbi:hypothetical protein NUACC26_000250 [Scytonema sp. NUACC26]
MRYAKTLRRDFPLRRWSKPELIARTCKLEMHRYAVVYCYTSQTRPCKKISLPDSEFHLAPDLSREVLDQGLKTPFLFPTMPKSAHFSSGVEEPLLSEY